MGEIKELVAGNLDDLHGDIIILRQKAHESVDGKMRPVFVVNPEGIGEEKSDYAAALRVGVPDEAEGGVTPAVRERAELVEDHLLALGVEGSPAREGEELLDDGVGGGHLVEHHARGNGAQVPEEAVLDDGNEARLDPVHG